MRSESSHDGGFSHRLAIVPGGALICDATGRVRFGLSDAALTGAGADGPDFMRLTTAHLALFLAEDAGMLDAPELSEPSGAASSLPCPGPSGLQGSSAMPGAEPSPDMDVIIAPGFLDDGLVALSLDARRRCRTAVPVVHQGDRVYVGPRLTPAEGPCVVCLQRAVAPNRQTEAFLADGLPPESERTRIGDIAWQVIRAAGDGLRETVFEVESGGAVVELHQVRSFPDCPLCGSARADPNVRPPDLRSCPRHPSSDTGARVSDPAGALERYQHLISPLTGAVRYVREVDTGAPGLIHVQSASHALDMRSARLSQFMRDGRDQSGGKGSTAGQARASALCEALERFSAVFRGDEVDVVARCSDLEAPVSPTECMLFSAQQYRDREECNARAMSPFQHIPEPFDADAEIAWSRVWCLVTGAETWVPTSFLYFGFRGPGQRCCYSDSNGLAAGQTLEEAILQGFFEVVERDAVAVWWYNRGRYPVVDIGSFQDGYIDAVVNHYDGLGRDLWVLDVTSDLGIPVFAAVSARRGEMAPEVIFGFGAHLDPAIALRRCVTEMNQLLATVIRPAGVRTAQLRGDYHEALHWWAHATLEDNAYLVPSPDLEARRVARWGYQPTRDILDDVHACIQLARRHGLQVLVRDVTRSDLEIAVAKVMVPGLRHFWRRLAPGRLYDVPVALGMRDAPLLEEDMNPVSLFV